MRLIDVEVARQPRNHDRSAAKTAGTSARAASLSPTLASALQPAAFALRAVAKLLNALLNVVLAAAAKILRAALRSGDAHAFRGTFGSSAVERQSRKVPAVSILSTAASARDSATGQRGKRAVHRQALKSAPGGNQRRQIP